jgi:sigma-B regulation protein RsbU (phosphoserine phosphatase)
VRATGVAPLYEKEYNRKGGGRVPVFIGMTMLEQEGDIAVAFVMDLTQLKQTEAQLSAANARLTAALTRERNIAVALQRSLTQMPAQDAFAGLQVHAVYEPAWEEADVGGDFMDAFLLDENRLAVVVGDVSGKGLGAAASTAEIKYTLRGMLYERGSPAAALTGLNEYLCDARRRGADNGDEFVCVSVAVVECATGKVVLSVSGTEPPLFIRLNGSAEETNVRGTPLGVFGEMVYREEETALDHGDMLLLTTDGITEARRGNEFFGYEGLSRAAARRRHTENLTELADGLLLEARDFAGGALHDDTCLLLVRRV